MEKSTRPAGKVREQYGDMVRQAVLASARRLFVEKGFANTPVRLLAEDAGVAVQTIYSAFGSKEGVLVALLDVIDEGIGMEEMQRQLAAAEDPSVMAEVVARMHRRLYELNADIVTLITQRGQSDVTMAPLIRRVQERRRAGVERLSTRMVGLGRMKQESYEAAAAHLEVLTHEQTYEFLRLQGWTMDRYEGWLREEVLLVLTVH